MSEVKPFIINEPSNRSAFHEQLESLWRIYKVEYEEAHPAPPIVNIRFIHDPHWKERWCSIQHTGDVARRISSDIMSPYAIVVSYVEDKIFWATFSFYNHSP